jgi:hypothetical protein
MLDPVLGDVGPAGEPHALVRADVVKQPGHRPGPPRPPGEPAVQADRHHPGQLGALLVQLVEGVPGVGEEVAAVGESGRADEAHVVDVQAVRHDQVRDAVD